jgi:hypothetical protein
MKILKNDKGFVVSVTAIIVSVILGVMILYFSNSIAPNITSSANNYSSTQARWAAISGMEHAFHKLIFGLDDIAGVYPFYNSNIVVDTMTVNPSTGGLQITSRGTHGSSIRIFSLKALPISPDSTVFMGFYDDEGYLYDPYGVGPGARWWGMSCGGELELPDDILFPTYVLTGADSCFFFGAKVQNNSNLNFLPVETSEGNYDLVLSLAAGKDVEDVTKQSDFQTGDFLEFYVNGVLLERWEGISEAGGNPMYPTVGVGTDVLGGIVGLDGELTPAFQDFHFNLTEILGVLDTMRLEIEGNTNTKLKYIGIEGISLFGSGYWSVETGSYIEI